MRASGRNVSYLDNSRFSPDRMKTRGTVGGRRTHNSLGEESLDVEEGDVEHEGKQKNDKDDLCAFEKGQGERFPPEFFNGGEEHVSSIENGDGQ